VENRSPTILRYVLCITRCPASGSSFALLVALNGLWVAYWGRTGTVHRWCVSPLAIQHRLTPWNDFCKSLAGDKYNFGCFRHTKIETETDRYISPDALGVSRPRRIESQRTTNRKQCGKCSSYGATIQHLARSPGNHSGAVPFGKSCQVTLRTGQRGNLNWTEHQ
jgi:hypothetical protein